MKFWIWNIFAVLMIILGIIFLIEPKQVYCGIIEQKPVQYTQGKYVRQENLFIINFEGKGRHVIYPSDLEFYTFEVGNRICYERREGDFTKSGKPVILFIGTLILVTVTGIVWINKLFKA